VTVEYLFLNDDERALVQYMRLCDDLGVEPRSAHLTIPPERIASAMRVLEAVGVVRKRA
jgi:hypothetical protein